MARYAVRFPDDDVTHGYDSDEEVRRALEQYQSENPGTMFHGVSIHEMTPGSTVGTERHPYDFVPQQN